MKNIKLFSENYLSEELSQKQISESFEQNFEQKFWKKIKRTLIVGTSLTSKT